MKLSVLLIRTSSSYLCIKCAVSTTFTWKRNVQHNIVAIDAALQALSAEVCRSLFFVHAMSVSDTTSAMFGVRQAKSFRASEELSAGVLIFGDLTARKNIYCSKLEKTLFQSCTVQVKAFPMSSVIVNYLQPSPYEHTSATSRAFCYHLLSRDTPTNDTWYDHRLLLTPKQCLRMKHLCP